MKHGQSPINRFSELVSEGNLDAYSNEIVASLGGIDQILTEYIRITRKYEDEELLTESQMNHIAGLVSKDWNSVDTVDTLSKVTNTDQDDSGTVYDRLYAKADLKNGIFHLNRAETILHTLFANQKTADCLIAILFNKITVFCSFMISAPFILVNLGGADHMFQETWFFVLGLMQEVLILIYFVLLIMCCNVPALLLIMSGFDFWIKLYYSISAAICYIIYSLDADFGANERIWLGLQEVLVVFTVIFASLIEGYGTSWRFSFGFGLLISTTFSLKALGMTFNILSLEERQFELWPGASFELVAFMASAARVLSLFLWKQTLMAAYTRGEWCICIYLSPQIKWKD